MPCVKKNPSVKRPKRNYYLKKFPHSRKKYRCRKPKRGGK